MTEVMKRGGIQKEYEKTSTTFTKKGLWPERYHNEIAGLLLASQYGISVPEVISHSIDENGGTVIMRRVYRPRLDQVLWGNAQPAVFKKIGAILARIHEIPSSEKEASLSLFKRRFQDLQMDILHLSVLRHELIDVAAKVITTISKKILNQSKVKFIHGDFTIQNMFGGNGIVVYDWEHSSSGSLLYDIGVSLSFMILLVTDGGWSFQDYHAGVDCFLEGYSGVRLLSDEDLRLIDGLRFLGHRQVAQYYLFILEYLAFVEGVSMVQDVFNQKTSLKPSTLYNQLCNFGVCFDKNWFYKIILPLRREGYRVSTDFWRWFNQEVDQQEQQEQGEQ